MTLNELDRIEQILRVTLPEWYRHSLIEYPFQSPDPALFDEAEQIIQANQEIRRDGWFGFPWPVEFFVIGDSEGDPFFILPLANDRRVFIASHDGGPEPVSGNLCEMASADSIEQHVSEAIEINRQTEVLILRRKTKKWWQFWI